MAISLELGVARRNNTRCGNQAPCRFVPDSNTRVSDHGVFDCVLVDVMMSLNGAFQVEVW